MKAAPAALAVLLALCGGCAAIGLRPGPEGTYASAMPADALGGKLGALLVLDLQPNGKYYASDRLIFAGRQATDNTLGTRTMQQSSVGAWAWSPPHVLLHRDLILDGSVWEKHIWVVPPTADQNASLTATFQDGQWAIFWNNVEYRLLSAPEKHALETGDYRALSFRR